MVSKKNILLSADVCEEIREQEEQEVIITQFSYILSSHHQPVLHHESSVFFLDTQTTSLHVNVLKLILSKV